MQVPEPRAQRPEESARPGQTRSLEPRGPKAESWRTAQLPRHDEPLRSRSPGRPHRRRTKCSDVPPRRGGREGRASTARFTSSHPLGREFRDSVQHSARHSGSLWDPTHTATLGFTHQQTIVHCNSTATCLTLTHSPWFHPTRPYSQLQSITTWPAVTPIHHTSKPDLLLHSSNTAIHHNNHHNTCYLIRNSDFNTTSKPQLLSQPKLGLIVTHNKHFTPSSHFHYNSHLINHNFITTCPRTSQSKQLVVTSLQ